jgi:hypothetical protein
MKTCENARQPSFVRTVAGAQVAALLFVLLAVSAGADEESVQLGIEAVDSDFEWFELVMEPGESTDLTVRFSNRGTVATGASVYPADVRTIRGGGMGMAEMNQPRTGPTEWLDFEDEEFDLEPGDVEERSFTVTVPDDVDPGEYITSIVIQNTEPIDIGEDDGRFDQTVRQGLAIAIEIPGEREAGMEIIDTQHIEAGERSIVEVYLENTGLAHLRPAGTFALADTDGEILAESSISLDTFYSGTETVIEITFSDRLPEDEFLIQVSLEDEQTGASVQADDIPLNLTGEDSEVEADDDGATGAVGSPGATVAENPGWSVIIGGLMVLFGTIVIVAAFFVYRLVNRPRFTYQPPRPSPSPPVPERTPRRQIRQLTPPRRHH